MCEIYILGAIVTLIIRGYLAYGKDFQMFDTYNRRRTTEIDGEKVFGYLLSSVALSIVWFIAIFPTIGFLIAKSKGKKS